MALWLARSAARVALLLSVLAVVGAAAFAVATIDGRQRADVTDAVASATSAGRPAPTTRVSGDLSAERDGADLLRRAIADAPLRTARTVITSSFPVLTGPAATGPDSSGSRSLRVKALSVENLRAHARLVDGAWPTASDENVHAVLQADAAKRAGLGPGDRLRIDSGGEIVVDGTWRPRDGGDPVWAGNPAVNSGRGLDYVGPLVVAESDLARLPVVDPTVVTTLSPAVDFGPADVRLAEAALDRLTSAADERQDLTVDGALGDRLSDVETELVAGRALLVVALSVVMGVAFVTLRQLLALLAEVRAQETRLLRARGATVSGLVTASALETAVVAGVGAALGVGAAQIVVTEAPALTTGLAATGVALVMAVVVTARTVGDTPGAPSRRPHFSPRLILVCAAAGISLAELLINGAPLSRTTSGRIEVDPVSVLAPALLLLALCLVGLALLTPGLRPLERLAARWPSLAPALPVRRLARQLSTYRVAVVVLALAAGFAVAASMVVSTWDGLARASADVTNASDVRVSLRLPAAVDANSARALAPYRAIDADGRAALTTEGRVESEPVDVVAVDADHIAATATASARHLDLQRWSTLLGAGDGPAPAANSVLGRSPDLTLGLDGAPQGRIQVAAWLTDEAGRIDRVEIADRRADDVDGARARLDVPEGRWRVIAVEASAAGAEDSTRLSVDGLPGGSVTVALDSGHTSARTVLGPVPDELPVVVTPAVSRMVQADVGDRFALLLPGTGVTVTARVAALAEALPTVSGSRGLLADLTTLTNMSLATGDSVPAPDEMWLPTDRPQAVAAAAAAAGVVRGTVSTAAPDRFVVATALDAWGPASAAVAGFALLATAAMTAGVLRSRRLQLRVLRVLGVRAGQQGWHQAGELAGACLAGLLLGIVAGAMVGAVTARLLARTAVPERPPGLTAHLDLGGGWLAVVSAVLVVGCGAISWGAGRSSARRGRTGTDAAR